MYIWLLKPKIIKLMKTFFTKNTYLLLILVTLFSCTTFAQSPQKISFQAIVRNASNALVTSANVSLRISLLQGTSTGTVAYSETHNVTTNTNGLATIQIGGGTVLSGTFSAINWANGPYFIKSETDPNGGSNYNIVNVTQLLSVPYALYAETSGSSLLGPQGPQGVAGTNGTNGIDGKNALVNTTTEPAGANCFNGGTKIEYGLDANNNGTLDAGEVNATLTKYVCNGATGAQGPQGVAGAAGSAGATGPQGLTGTAGATGPQGVAGATGPQGVAGATGPQGPIGLTGSTGSVGATGAQGTAGTNGTNGTNGIDGKNALIKTTAEPTGTNCATGGTKVEVGLDANNNDTLDAGEVNPTLTKYVCNGNNSVNNTGILFNNANVNIGDFYDGGVIFHIDYDSSGCNSILITSINDNIAQIWSDKTEVQEPAFSWDGIMNTYSNCSHTPNITAASLCAEKVESNHADWYLPASKELIYLDNNLIDVNRRLNAIGSADLIDGEYWSSTNSTATGTAYSYDFAISAINTTAKSTTLKSRAIRKVFNVNPAYIVGQAGPAGGTVFYDKGCYSDGWRYLEVNNSTIAYGLMNNGSTAGFNLLVNSFESLGKGYENSLYYSNVQSIINCLNFTINGFSDWYLPNVPELNLITLNLPNFLTQTNYHSSSKVSGAVTFYNFNVVTGNRSNTNSTANYYTIPVRRF